MANQPKYTGDQEQDSWAFQVTQELNEVRNRVSQGRRLPQSSRLGNEFYLTEEYTDNNPATPVDYTVGWYKYVDSDVFWVQIS